ncbi:MAG: hypothetical protein KDB29_05405 [Planctomycetes bacterium]|nr:hypothetical protein [Planctomycetota bacterium]
MNTSLRFALKALVLISILVVVGTSGTGQNNPAKKSGYDPTTRTVGWMFFKYSYPDSWEGTTEQEYAIVEQEQGSNHYSQHVLLTRVRRGLWALNMEPMEGWSVEHVGMVFSEGGKETLATFESKAWSTHVANDLNSDSVKHKDTDLADPDAVVIRYLWFTADTTNAGLKIGDDSYVEYLLPQDWQVGSTFWYPLTRIGDNEFIDTVLVYERTKPEERPKEVRIRVLDADGNDKGRATVPVTVLSSRGIRR